MHFERVNPEIEYFIDCGSERVKIEKTEADKD